MRRILLITGLWPTPDQPSAGIFVMRRVADAPITVVAPRSYRGPMPLRYLRLAVAAVTTRGRFSGVEAHPLFPVGLIGLVAARIRRIPLVTYAHGADVRETAVENRLYRMLARMVVRGAARTIANSSETASLVASLGGTATIIPPGVDLARFHPSPRPSSRRVLYLGGADPVKGLEIARVHADTLAGPGIMTIDPDDVPALIQDHDIVLIPSRAEGFGLVAAEAIASGRWVVARSVGGIPGIVEDGVTGTLVHADDEFGRAIAAVGDYDPEVVAAHAARFSIEQSNREMAEVWAEVLPGG